jgi:hypothetical protein
MSELSELLASVQDLKLTKPQLTELRLLAAGRRSTRICGAGVSKVHNNLALKGLCRFTEEDGSTPGLSVYAILASYGNPRPWCEITAKGRAALMLETK